MDVQDIKDLRDAVPFVPFSLHLNSGQVIEVKNHDELFIPPTERHIIVDNGRLLVIDPSNVSSLAQI
jgi:hypothetical protein